MDLGVVVQFWWVFFSVALIALGWGIGGAREKSHLERLDTREAELASVVVINTKVPPPGAVAATIVFGDAVIATDRFKQVASQLRGMLGGEVRTLQTMLDRARREARVRMLEEARAAGATSVVNVRFENVDVGPTVQRQGAGSAEIICYGTAVIPHPLP